MIERSKSIEDSIELEKAIIDLYLNYGDLKNLNLIEFSNKSFETYMHSVFHIPELVKKFKKISVFNC